MAKATTSTTYVIFSPLDGSTLDKRHSTSGRIYSHAVAVQLDVEYARQQAQRWTDLDQRNAEWTFNHSRTGETIANAFGSLENYCDATRKQRIGIFESELAEGHYDKLIVVGYQGRPDLAQKEHLRQAKRPDVKAVYTIPAVRTR